MTHLCSFSTHAYNCISNPHWSLKHLNKCWRCEIMKSYGRRALHFGLINSFLWHSFLSWKPMAGLPGGFRMQLIKQLRATSDPCLTTATTSLYEITPFTCLSSQCQKKKKKGVSPCKCGGYNSTAEPVGEQDWTRKKAGGGEFEPSMDGNHRLPNTYSKLSPMGWPCLEPP